MLNLLLFIASKRKKGQPLEEAALKIQNGDTNILEEVLDSYKPFVKKTVSSVCKRYIYESDDEFSIGLIAFHDAILNYKKEKGASLLSFSEVIIKRKVIDYIRKQRKNQAISLDLHEDELDAPQSIIESNRSIEEYDKTIEISERQEEIRTFVNELKQYKLTLDDLLEQSPKHEDARVNAIAIAEKIVETAEIRDYLLEKKRLPLKKLEKMVSVSRKTIERNRKYIIAISLIIMGEYVFLRDYLKGRINK
ncbi:RNA polymerase sigma factor [Bacillus pakistanensis]|uniref:RNA polymerase sigma factor SigI n=1 Tax=Rossellomorea pakistanensis TaxID=992288 RepID=A0ABS2NFQ3_9BACI|nr:RNA polymerase sigma factor SigI [Bacillus pakistanensis]MBM7586594.1 RNA polymerase sigma factor [Bacillus pakistanensis]